MSDAPSFSHTILLVDPDLDYLDWCTKALGAESVRILRCDTADKALKVTEKTTVDIIIADMILQPFSGPELMSKVRAKNPDQIFILTSTFPSTSQIIEATQGGAHEVLRKESLTFELRGIVEKALVLADQRNASTLSSEEKQPTSGRSSIIGVSRALQNVLKVVGRVAQSDAPVLVFGESGTGKELIAKSIHDYSPRRNNDLMIINCGAIPDNLLESELFGHEKGSFTGAMARRKGRFEDCHEGTLFLDEVGDLPGNVQVKLLRVLQDGSFSRVGSNEILKTDVRIVAATNKDLAAEVSAGNFREDLYYRLNVVEITLPPLRHRREDIPLLAEFFLDRIARKSKQPRLKLSNEAKHFLSEKHHWPGNVRELENTLVRACALASSEVLVADDIPLGRAPEMKADNVETAAQTFFEAAARKGSTVVEEARIELVRHALKQVDNDYDAAAKLLGVPVETVRDWTST